MKKLICVLLVVVLMATMLTACAKFKCDLCGEEKTGKKYTEEVFGEEIEYCKECHDKAEEMAEGLKDLLN